MREQKNPTSHRKDAKMKKGVLVVSRANGMPLVVLADKVESFSRDENGLVYVRITCINGGKIPVVFTNVPTPDDNPDGQIVYAMEFLAEGKTVYATEV